MDHEPTAAPRPRRYWLRCLGCLAAPVLLVALLIAEENLRGRWALSRVESAMQAEGARWKLADLGLPPPVPAGNAAPAVLAAAAELAKLEDGNRLVSAGPRNLMKLAAPGKATCAYREARFPSRNGFRNADKEAPAGADDWLLAQTQLNNAKGPLDRLRAALGQPALALESTYGVKLPRFSALFYAHAWLMSHGLCALHGGDLDAAIDDIVACCALARLQRTDLHLASQKSAEIIDVSATLLIWEALQAGGWTEERLARLQQGARDGEQLDIALRSFEVERALAPVLFDSARENSAARITALRMQGGRLIESIMGDDDTPPQSELGVRIHAFLWWAAWSQQDEARTLEHWRVFLAEARRIGADRSWTDFVKRYPKLRSAPGGFSQWRWSFSDLMSPSSAWYVLSSLSRNGTERQMALAAIALKRAELKNHALPETLAALAPEFLAQAPLDFMDGKPLRYQPAKDRGFALYSIGLDGKDDGGDPSTQTGDTRVRSLWGGRDAVWPVAAAPTGK